MSEYKYIRISKHKRKAGNKKVTVRGHIRKIKR